MEELWRACLGFLHSIRLICLIDRVIQFLWFEKRGWLRPIFLSINAARVISWDILGLKFSHCDFKLELRLSYQSGVDRGFRRLFLLDKLLLPALILKVQRLSVLLLQSLGEVRALYWLVALYLTRHSFRLVITIIFVHFFLVARPIADVSNLFENFTTVVEALCVQNKLAEWFALQDLVQVLGLVSSFLSVTHRQLSLQYLDELHRVRTLLESQV